MEIAGPGKRRGLFASRPGAPVEDAVSGTMPQVHPSRLLLPLLGAVAALAVLLPFPAAGAYSVQTVEISEGGFNPPSCQMNREYIRFKNTGSTPRRVTRPAATEGDPPLWDSGVLAPGETSNQVIIPYGGATRFVDPEFPDHFLIVRTPVMSKTWDVICSPDPSLQPPPPPCRLNAHCLRLPAIAVDNAGSQ